MAKDATGIALSVLNSFSGSSLPDKLGIRKSSEKAVYGATRGGFKAIALASRQFKSVSNLAAPKRLPNAKAPSDLFDLSLTEEQQMMQDNLSRFASDVIRPAAADANETLKTPHSIIKQSAELGLAMFALPEDLGGIAEERSTVTNLLMAEDLAKGDMGIALSILSSIGVINALTQWGTAYQQSQYLAAFAEEDMPRATIAINEPKPLFSALTLDTTATPSGDGYLISGVKSAVPQLRNSELLLVAANIPGEGPAIFIIEGNQKGLIVEEEHAMGLRSAELCRLTLDGVSVSRNAKLGGDDFSYQTFLDFGSLAWCGLALGTGQAILDYTIEYCNERQAFGEPISHRQAVAFMIANIEIELQSMRIVTQRAAARAERGLSFQREAFLARLLCNEKGMQIGTDGVQLLGGHGFTKEHPVERWYRDMRAISILNGGLHL